MDISYLKNVQRLSDLFLLSSAYIKKFNIDRKILRLFCVASQLCVYKCCIFYKLKNYKICIQYFLALSRDLMKKKNVSIGNKWRKLAKFLIIY